MFKRLLVVLVAAFAVAAASESASAQSIGYSGYTRSATGFGCAYMPSFNNGQYYIKSFTASYVQNGVTKTVGVQRASYWTWYGTKYTWYVTGAPANTPITVSLEYGFTTNPGFSNTIGGTYTVPANYQTTGTLGIVYCW